MSVMKLRGKVNFPANVTGTGGITVTKVNGIWTIDPDWTALDLVTTLDTPEDKQLWAYDPVDDIFVRIAVDALIDSLPAGPTGPTGATGATSGILQAYSSATTDADPGAGTFRLNNATPASATAAYLDNLDAGGATVSGIWDLFDDSGSVVKGILRFEKSTDPTKWAQFQVTGSVVDGTGYRKITLANGAGSGAFTAADVFAISFARSGDNGSGDFSSNTATSVDGEVVLFSGTGGKTGKRATLTATVVKSASGVQSAAAAGTDYMAPGTTSNLTAGFTTTSDSDGTWAAAATYTPDPTTGNFKHITANGAFTLAPPTATCTMIVEVLNGASAGAITTSGFTIVKGDTYLTTNALKWAFHILKTQNYSRLTIEALQ